MKSMLHLGSILLLLVTWIIGSDVIGVRLLPEPSAVALALVDEARSGALTFNLGVTLLRVFAAFAIAMVLGTVIGLLMGRNAIFDWLADPWLVVLLNLPALVIIVLAYIWAGLTDTAAIAAVALNKLPVTIVTIREGARALDPTLDEMATVFRMKIVLIVEMLGRPNGVGFEIGAAFQLFDVTRILAYALAFTVVMLAIEALLVQPLERHVSRWRLRPA